MTRDATNILEYLGAGLIEFTSMRKGSAALVKARRNQAWCIVASLLTGAMVSVSLPALGATVSWPTCIRHAGFRSCTPPLMPWWMARLRHCANFSQATHPVRKFPRRRA